MTSKWRQEIRDVVCGMRVGPDSFPCDYEGIHFAFCSEQCRQHFQARPHLYIGDPKHGKAVRQQGQQLLKKHRITLKELPDAEHREHILNSVNQLMGVKHCELDGRNIQVEYDLLAVSLKDIEQAITSQHVAEDDSALDKLRRAVIHLSEECELDQLSHPGDS